MTLITLMQQLVDKGFYKLQITADSDNKTIKLTATKVGKSGEKTVEADTLLPGSFLKMIDVEGVLDNEVEKLLNQVEEAANIH